LSIEVVERTRHRDQERVRERVGNPARLVRAADGRVDSTHRCRKGLVVDQLAERWNVPGIAVDSLPKVRVEHGARARIRAGNAERRSVVVALDDDPTGSQTVHGVDIVTVLDPAEFASALDGAVADGRVDAGTAEFFVLTNTRSVSEARAVATNREVARELLRLAEERGLALELVSRSDSTLRGHVVAEPVTLDAARREQTGRGHDGVLFVPAFFEAGRITAGDTHWARVDGDFRPVGETEFARDATFGYTASDLRAFLAERSGGALRAEDVHSVGLDDIRTGGPDRVAELLAPVRDGAWVVVNATEYADLDVVALGLQAARERGQVFLHRCGPSWMQVLAGLDAAPPLAPDRIAAAAKGKRGLVVVGSHVAQTSRQVERAVELADLAVVELDARRLVDPADAAREDYLAEVTRAAAAALAEQDVLLMTSRELVRAEEPADSLRIANRVSDGLSTVVSRIRGAGLGWVVTKGGITSHEIAATGLGIRRARVEGQLFPGTVSMMRPLVAPPEVVGLPWVVFAGNVGDTDTLARVVTTMRGSDA
jgi:uncharacterized protein YgbK (DUF1537 family)